MTSIPKTYEGTTYVSHTVEPVPLRRSPTKRWQVDIQVEIPEGLPDLPFSGVFDLPADFSGAKIDRWIDSFCLGMKKRWNKRTSTSDEWIEDLKADLKKVAHEG